MDEIERHEATLKAVNWLAEMQMHGQAWEMLKSAVNYEQGRQRYSRVKEDDTMYSPLARKALERIKAL